MYFRKDESNINQVIIRGDMPIERMSMSYRIERARYPPIGAENNIPFP